MDELKKKCKHILSIWLISVPLYNLGGNIYNATKIGNVNDGFITYTPGFMMFNFWVILLVFLPLTLKLYKSAVAAQMRKTKFFSAIMLVSIILWLIMFILFYIARLFLPDLGL